MTDSDTTRTPNPPSEAGAAAAPSQPAAPQVPLADAGAVPPPPAAPQPPPAASQPPPAAAWRPPPSDSGRNVSVIVGAIILVIGLWFFATRTLGLDLPELDWGSLWPLLLIGIGAWIVFGAMRQRSR